MPYYGYVEVEVRLMREGHGVEGKEVKAVSRRVVRFEEYEVKHIGRTASAEDADEATANDQKFSEEMESAVRKVLDDDAMIEMRVRWDRAVVAMTPEKMGRALEVLESDGS